MMIYELDEIEKDALLGPKPQPSQVDEFFEVQTFWCPECQEWHRASVLGGLVGGEHDGQSA